MIKPDWFPNWTNKTVIIVASGPSASADKEILRKLKDSNFNKSFGIVVINSSFQLVHNADVLYAADGKWWEKNREAWNLNLLKITSSSVRLIKPVALHRVKVITTNDPVERNQLIFEPKGTLGSGGNSGFQVINLVIQFGAKFILLVGFDMTLKMGYHWHKDHGQGFFKPTKLQVEEWRKNLDSQAGVLHDHGIKIINTSMESALRNYPKVPLIDILEKVLKIKMPLERRVSK